jgi:putative transposase
MIEHSDWSMMTETQFEAFQHRISLVESLLDDDIPESDRTRMRDDYRLRTGIGERTLRNWLRWYRKEGPERLTFWRSFEPAPRIADAALAASILKLIEERPLRTVPQLRRLLQAGNESAVAVAHVSDRTIYRFLTENGLSVKQRSALSCAPGRESYHQFQALAAMVLVQGDARDGIWLPDTDGKARKTYLFAWVDDYSRRILHARYYWDEQLPRMEDSFRDMILRWGIPEKVYLDNGNVYIARQFAWILAQLGIKKIHHPPYHAWCKGKVEAVMKTLKLDFQAEAERAGFLTLEELNTALWTGSGGALFGFAGIPRENRQSSAGHRSRLVQCAVPVAGVADRDQVRDRQAVRQCLCDTGRESPQCRRDPLRSIRPETSVPF